MMNMMTGSEDGWLDENEIRWVTEMTDAERWKDKLKTQM